MFNSGREILKFKAKNKSVDFPTQNCLGSINNWFSATQSIDISLNGNVYDLPVNFNSIDKCVILNIRKYQMSRIV